MQSSRHPPVLQVTGVVQPLAVAGAAVITVSGIVTGLATPATDEMAVLAVVLFMSGPPGR